LNRGVGLLCAALLVGCAPPLRSDGFPIVGGEPTTDFEAVVAVYWLGGYLCSGVVVEPRRVLTAAHCVYGFPEDDAGLSVRFGPQAATPEREILATSFAVHPDYSTSLSRDVALIELREDAPVAPTGWNSEPLGDPLVGEDIDIVGFGLTVVGEDDPDAFRRRGVVTVDEVTDLQIRWTGDDANLCEGDSGGAALRDGELLGLLVEGDTFCIDWGAALRLDAVDPWLSGADPADDDDAIALPDDDDDDAPAPACSGCTTAGPAPSLLLLLLLPLRRRRR
jgi:hypothetical protein